MIYFAMPSEKERLVLWQKAFEGRINVAEDVDLKQISKEFVKILLF